MAEIHSQTVASDVPVIPKLIPIIKGSDQKFDLTITEDLLNKIKYLCSEFPEQEWSGVLFYNAIGDISDLSTMKLVAFDLYPLDLGSKTYTEFEHTTDYAGYMARNPELLNSLQGLIHSHNSMSTFFSGTDTATLQEQAPVYNNYLSLIVNNIGSYTAAIGVNATIESALSEKILYKGLEYSEKSFGGEIKESTKNVVLKFDANIIKEGVVCTSQDFIDSVNELKRNEQKQSFKNRSTPFIPGKSVTTAIEIPTQGTLFHPKEFINAGIVTDQMIEVLCKVASQNYFYEIDSNRSLESNLLEAMKTIPTKLSHQKYSQFVYESIENILSFLDINAEDEQVLVISGILNGILQFKDKDNYFGELYDSFTSYYDQIVEEIDMEEEFNIGETVAINNKEIKI